MFDFTGKVALIVGGAGYLGMPVSRAFVEQGARVVLTDLRAARAAQVAQGMDDSCAGWSLDLADEAQIGAAIHRVVTEYGRLDVLVNASYLSFGQRNVETLQGDEFEASLRVQLTGAFLLAREAGRVMADGGAMVFFSSMYGRVSPDPRIYQAPQQPNPLEYGVGKAGLEQMIRYLAVHYAPRNLRVNGVAPGPFPHPIPADPEFEAFCGRLSERVPLGRIGRQYELAGPVLFLASAEASYITGHILPVDGGWTIW